MSAEILSFETGRPAELADDEPSLVVDVEGYEGPLDLLLALARRQKGDLGKLSILALADQYLVFIEAARKIRLELAADYLVMAAWLAFLKSRLLLPEPVTADGPSAEEMATALANRLRRLEAIREASNRLMNRPQLQRDIFPRGDPESIAEIRHPRFTATLFDLLAAYAAQRQQRVLATVHLAKRTVWSLGEARASLERLIGMAQDWSRLDEYLLNYVVDPSQKATVFASSFAAALELVREGAVELHQKEAFAPLYFRKRPPQPVSDAMTAPDLPAEEVEGGDRAMARPAEKRKADAEERSIDPQARPEELRLLEALLFASSEPLDQATLAKRMPDGVDIKVALAQLQADYASRGVNLVRVANKWTFRTAGDLSWLMMRETTETRRLSRAAIEMLAIIAYHQPVTRAEIEEIRGVITSKGTLDVLLETGWIRPRGRRKKPGRPLTFGTTEAFLSQFSLEALSDLPGLEELKGTGLLDSRLPSGFSVPTPSDDPALRDDEDPLEIGDLELALAPAVEPENGGGS